MKASIERMQALQEKINQLKIEQDKVEQLLVSHLVQVLKINNAFQLDFDALVGGLLEVIDVIKSNTERKETWQNSGHKFCQSRFKIKTKHPKTNSSFEKNYVSD